MGEKGKLIATGDVQSQAYTVVLGLSVPCSFEICFQHHTSAFIISHCAQTCIEMLQSCHFVANLVFSDVPFWCCRKQMNMHHVDKTPTRRGERGH